MEPRAHLMFVYNPLEEDLEQSAFSYGLNDVV